MIACRVSLHEAEEAIAYVAPVGEKALYVEQARAAVSPFLRVSSAIAA